MSLLTDFQELRDHDEWLADKLAKVTKERDEARQVAREVWRNYSVLAPRSELVCAAVEESERRYPWLKEATE